MLVDDVREREVLPGAVARQPRLSSELIPRWRGPRRDLPWDPYSGVDPERSLNALSAGYPDAQPTIGRADTLESSAAGVPSAVSGAAIRRCVPRRQRNYLFFLPLRPRCMIGDLGISL